LQRAHELAVDDARRERIQLARGRRDPDFIEKGEPLLDFAGEHEPARLGDPADRRCRRIGSRADLDRAAGPRACAVRVARQKALVVANRREPRVHGRIANVAEEALGARQPAAHRRHQGRVEEQMHRDPHRGARGPEIVSRSYALGVRALPGFDRDVEVPGRIRDLGDER
jgi:hypothetical protein